MPWKPDVQPGEVVLVACNTEARRRVLFHVVLTDQRLIYARPTVWSLDGMVTEARPLSSLHEVKLQKLRPYGLWAFGVFAAAGFVAALASLQAGWFVSVGMLAAAAFAFGSARKRVRLVWRGGGLSTPAGSHDGVRAEMADALREIARLLGDRNQLSLKARPERASEPEIDDGDKRELCPDGNCTGVLGADGRCRVCGAGAGRST